MPSGNCPNSRPWFAIFRSQRFCSLKYAANALLSTSAELKTDQGELRVAGEERGGAHGVRRRICANPKPPRVRGSCVRISSESSSPVDAIAGLTLFLDLRLSAAFGLPATRAI
jgi:hypothetical protein